MMNRNSDLHCHPSLKPAYNKGYDGDDGDIWKEYNAKEDILNLNKLIQNIIREMSRSSQSNLESCVDGNIRLIFASIYPFERSFFDIQDNVLRRLLLSEKNYISLGTASVGIASEEVEKIISGITNGVNYFLDYNKELEVLTDETNKKSKKVDYQKYSFQLAKDFADYESLKKDENKIVGILTVEGAHTFGNYDFENPFKLSIHDSNFPKDKIPDLRNSFRDNIEKVKQETDTSKIPFFITFCHHFNNLLAGHAPSINRKTKIFFNQDTFLDQGFSDLGKEVLDMLLTRTNGRRILIDVKHMSSRSRVEFYEAKKVKYLNDDIPIVNSHAAVNGFKTLSEANNINFKKGERLTKRHFFSKGTISLTNEDIQEIFCSNGIIGVCLHEGRMPGGSFRKDKRDIEKEYERGKISLETKSRQITNLFMKLFWSNIIHIVKIQKNIIQEPEQYGHPSNLSSDPWRGITVGSDYDGIVDAFDNIETAENFIELREDMMDYFSSQNSYGKDILDVDTEEILRSEEVSALIELDGNTLENRIEQIMMGNVEFFLSRYFTKEYLNQK